MKIITLTREEFENFSNRHNYNTFYQSIEYANFMKINEQYNIHYLGFVDKTNTMIGASLMLYKVLFWGYKAAYAPRGFLINYDNPLLIEDLIESLKQLLKKQKFIFIKIDPPIVLNERDCNGNIIKTNNGANQIINTFNRNNVSHFGFNLYNESKLPRWYVVAKLNKDGRIIYNNFDNDIKEKITYANNMAITVKQDETNNFEEFNNFLKKIHFKKNSKYLHNMFTTFKNSNRLKVFYAKIDTKKYVQNANKLYSVEEEKNNALASIIQSGDSVKYNIPKAINDKMISDKHLHNYKKDIVESTKLLKNFPDGINCGVALTIEDARGVNILINASDTQYERYHVETLLNYELMKYFGKENYQYINLGAISGNFDKTSKYYSLLNGKIGFNSSILEYIGEFDIILNPTMYRIYQKKYKIVK